MSYKLYLAPAAEADIDDVLLWSVQHFGTEIHEAYEALIVAAIRDVALDPDRAGSHARPELGTAVRSFPIRSSRIHVPDNVRSVKQPRHVIYYRLVGETVHIARVLHETMDASLYWVN